MQSDEADDEPEMESSLPDRAANVGAMARVSVVGRVNADTPFVVGSIPRPGEMALSSSVIEAPGGNGGNQAVAAARAGARVDFVGALGPSAIARVRPRSRSPRRSGPPARPATPGLGRQAMRWSPRRPRSNALPPAAANAVVTGISKCQQHITLGQGRPRVRRVERKPAIGARRDHDGVVAGGIHHDDGRAARSGQQVSPQSFGGGV
ncbi:PfkB family carbohydrate kinase [Mycobacterium saskatchewanense]|uniref:PfkB family carbohydrate kinase n=1 Tax=Mycobacterium saskatchewanense TaxID=220927 RepID=UPI0038CC1715